MVQCIIVVVYSADCCGSFPLLCSRIIADSCLLVAFVLLRELLFSVHTIMTARSTRNSQAAAFDAIVSVPETNRPRSSDANVPRSSTQTPVVPSTSQAPPSDQPSPAFLASVVNAVKQALAAEQASNLPVTSSMSVPGGVPPSSLSSGQLDAQVSALAASGVDFAPVLVTSASATAQGRPNFLVPSFISTFASPITIFVQHRCWEHITRFQRWFFIGPVACAASAVRGWPGVFTHSTIPAKLVSQIVAGKFVELNELLSVNVVSTESEPQLLFDGRLVLTSPPKKPKRRIGDTSSWLEAFSVYSLILSSHFPQRWRDLLQYQLLILRTHRQFAGRVWLSYDRAFREHAAATNLTDWSSINVQLFNFHAAGASANPGRDLSDDSTEPHGASSSHIICKSWNRGCCVAPSSSCRFAHKCSSCFGTHRVGACPGEPPNQS